MSFYFRDSPRFTDRLRGMSDDELLREVKQRFNEEDAFPDSGRRTRGDSFDRPFPHFPRGFPFDDDDADVFQRPPRGDGIRAHLDDLATRHPDLAQHLRGPPWPFGSSLLRDRRHRRRGSGNSSNDGQQRQQSHQQVDEDARSQASGSSAASGASAVSSHSGGEPDSSSSSFAIPQYGLRNTVDIGQQQRRRNMETSPEKSDRGQRSMSAPPENRQQQQQQPPQQHGHGQQQQSPSNQGQRFVSRVDITPQHNQQQRAQSPNKPSSNVRHIPIFVEGRDEPVVSKLATDGSTPPFHNVHQQRQQPSPPPHFHKPPSHFDQHFGRQQWPPSHFENTFYEPDFEQPQPRRHQQQYQQPQYYQPQSQYYQQEPQYHQQQQQQPPPQSYHQQQQQPPQQPQEPQCQQQQQQQQQEQEIPKPKPPPVPKDPLEKVAQVQKEVDNLAEQVRRYVGGSRQDKEYIYLDEMLTRELLKLDDIETEGRENVRQARKNAIKTIQSTIGLLETKAPLAGQQEEQQPVTGEGEECSEEKRDRREKEMSRVDPEIVDVDAKREKPPSEPIPLPPAPLSPTKTKIESPENENATINNAVAEMADRCVATPASQRDTQIDEEDEQRRKIDDRAAESTTERFHVVSTEREAEEEKSEEGKNSDATTEKKDATSSTKQQTEETEKGKTGESPRLQRKVKRTRKTEEKQQRQQQPVSERAIPLPPPSTESAK